MFLNVLKDISFLQLIILILVQNALPIAESAVMLQHVLLAKLDIILIPQFLLFVPYALIILNQLLVHQQLILLPHVNQDLKLQVENYSF